MFPATIPYRRPFYKYKGLWKEEGKGGRHTKCWLDNVKEWTRMDSPHPATEGGGSYWMEVTGCDICSHVVSSSTTPSFIIGDAERDCLEKEPSERTEEDIQILFDFTRHLKAFSNMTEHTRRLLCEVMVFAIVSRTRTIVMKDGEELDSWSVIVKGEVEVVRPGGVRERLQIGDSFGVTPTMEKLHHQGLMRTVVNDCQFVCIAQSDYYEIMHQAGAVKS